MILDYLLTFVLIMLFVRYDLVLLWIYIPVKKWLTD